MTHPPPTSLDRHNPPIAITIAIAIAAILVIPLLPTPLSSVESNKDKGTGQW
jgi:hypothetical protein